MRRSSRIMGSLLTMAFAGCGAIDDFAGDGPTSAENSLVAPTAGNFTEQISLMIGPTTAWQSETAGAWKNGFEYMAYNAEDTDTSHVTYPQRAERDALNRPYVDRIVCPGTSQVGRNMWFRDEEEWVAARMPVPAGWSVLWSDPAVALFEGQWWISALGSPTDNWTARSNTTLNGKKCYRTSNFAGSGLPAGFAELTSPMAGACVQGTTLETINAPGSVQCFRRKNGLDSATGTDVLNGGSLAPCGSALYAAYHDPNTGTVAMYRKATGAAWAAVAGDSAIRTDNHPVLIEANAYTGIWMISANAGVLTVRTHNTSGFGVPVTVGSDYSNADVAVNGGAVVRGGGRGMAGIVAPNPSALKPATWIAYETKSTSANGLVKKKALLLMKCTTTCTLVGRIGGVDPLTGNGFNAFMPAMAIVSKLVNNVQTPIIGITYWTDQGQGANKVVMKYYTYGIDGLSRSNGTLTAAQVVCPGGGNYWGDYDGMYAGNNATAQANFHRSFTDSSEATCDTTTRANLDYRSQNQHVSNVWFSAL